MISLARVGKYIWGGSTEAFVHVIDPKGLRIKKKLKLVEASPIFSLLSIEPLAVVWVGLEGNIARVNQRVRHCSLGRSLSLSLSLSCGHVTKRHVSFASCRASFRTCWKATPRR